MTVIIMSIIMSIIMFMLVIVLLVIFVILFITVFHQILERSRWDDDLCSWVLPAIKQRPDVFSDGLQLPAIHGTGNRGAGSGSGSGTGAGAGGLERVQGNADLFAQCNNFSTSEYLSLPPTGKAAPMLLQRFSPRATPTESESPRMPDSSRDRRGGTGSRGGGGGGANNRQSMDTVDASSTTVPTLQSLDIAARPPRVKSGKRAKKKKAKVRQLCMF